MRSLCALLALGLSLSSAAAQSVVINVQRVWSVQAARQYSSEYRAGFPKRQHALATSDADPAAAPVISSTIDAAGILTVSVERRTGADDVLLEAITSSDIITWTPATFISDVPALTGRATRTWRCGTPLSRRVFVKVRASRLP